MIYGFKMQFTYYTKKGKFQTNDSYGIPLHKLHYPNEKTPALENHLMGHKFWYFEGTFHRLSGPAIIWNDENKIFCLNGKSYKNVKDWLKDHPNQDEVFQCKMLLQYS